MMRIRCFLSLERLVRDSIGSLKKLGLDYLWYDKERKVIEIWGPYYTHLNQQSAHIIRCELDYFIKPKLEETITEKQDELVQETVAAC